jgi:hypothetical protein
MKSFSRLQAVIMRHVAVNVQEEVVIGSGHWLMEARLDYAVAPIRKFINGPIVDPPAASTGEGVTVHKRLTAAGYGF